MRAKKQKQLVANTKEIRFYRANGKFGFLSNLYICCVEIDGKTFRSAEDAYQFFKPKKKEVAEWLISAPKPHLTALAAHSLLVWDIKENWNNIKVNRMRNVLMAKFALNKDLEEKLLATGDKILIEASKTDNFWGLGKKGTGKNMLGKLLMEVRLVRHNCQILRALGKSKVDLKSKDKYRREKVGEG